MDIEVIEVEVDDQAQTTALGALSDAQAAKALRLETERSPSPKINTTARAAAPAKKADGTQEIELGDVLEVMQKMPNANGKATQKAETASVELAATPADSAPKQIAAAPVAINPNATAEIRPGDVLEEIVVDEPAPLPQSQIQTAPMQPPSMEPAAAEYIPQPIPQAASSQSDLASTRIRPPAGPSRAPLAQFSVDDEVAPFASDTVDIPLDRVPGLPIWMQIKGKPGVAIVGGAIGACVLIGALAIGMHFHNSSDTTTASTDAKTTTSSAAMNMNHDDPSAEIPPPPATPDVPSVSINDLKKDGKAAPADAFDTESVPVSHSWAPASHHSHASHHSDAAAAAPATFVSQKHVTAKQPQGFGLIRTWIAARGEPIAVDGKVVGTAPSPVRVACGPHKVAIGSEVVQANVPCDGAVTVGSPDHKK
jgi:hypothetical protein